MILPRDSTHLCMMWSCDMILIMMWPCTFQDGMYSSLSSISLLIDGFVFHGSIYISFFKQDRRCYDIRYDSVLFFSRPQSEGWPHHGRTFSIYPCLLLYGESCPRLDVVAVCGLPRLRAPGIVPCIISFDLQATPLFPHGSFLPLTVCNSSLFTPALLRTDSFVFLLSTKPAESFLVLWLKGVQTCFFILSECPAYTAVCC